MNTYGKVLFICKGNTCRSPMSATILQHFLQDMDILVESRGMVVLFEEPYNPKAVAAAAKHGMIMPSNSSRQLKNSDFDNNTLVLVMNEDMKNKIYKQYDHAINVYTLNEFADDDSGEVADPYGHGAAAYNDCFEQLSRIISKAAKIIRNNSHAAKQQEQQML